MIDNLSIVIHKDYNQIAALACEKRIKSFILGSKEFSLRLPGDFTLEEIDLLKQNTNKEIIVAVNKLFHNAELAALEDYLFKLVDIGIKKVICADLAVIYLIKDRGLDLEVIYNTETTITNESYLDFFDQNIVTAIEAAKEITLAEIATLCENKPGQVGISIHGQIYMYHSRRELISNYLQALNNNPLQSSGELYLYDDERSLYYPIIEEENMTSILSSKDISMINHLDDLLKLKLNYLKLDGYLYKASDFTKIVQLYIKAIDQLESDYELYQDNRRQYLSQLKELAPYKQFGTAFFYKRTIY